MKDKNRLRKQGERFHCFLCDKVVHVAIMLMPLITLADTWTDKDYNTWEYTVSGGKATITKCKSSMAGTVSIPEKLNGIPVVKVGDYAYSNSKYISGLIIPDCITELGLSAFENCTALNNVVLGAGLKSVASTTFMGCTNIRSVKFGSFPSVLNAATITGDWIENGQDEATWAIYRCPTVPAHGKAIMKRQIVNDGYGDRIFSFRCKVSKLSREVDFEFQVDGVRQKFLGGYDDVWDDIVIDVPLESHILTWVYTVNGSSSAGGNA